MPVLSVSAEKAPAVTTVTSSKVVSTEELPVKTMPVTENSDDTTETTDISETNDNEDKTAANVHDSTVFDKVYDKVIKRFENVEVVAVDAGYKTPWICKKIIDDGRIPSMPYKRPMGKTGFFRPHEYVYDEHYDCVICPENQILKYSTTNRDGYKEFKSNPDIRKNCQSRSRCTNSKSFQKVFNRHVWQGYLDFAEDVRHSPLGKESYALRSQTIERVFADAKEKHAMRYTFYRGLSQVTNWIRLKYAAMNLKKLAVWAW